MKGATQRLRGDEVDEMFQSTLPMKGATDRLDESIWHRIVSIHAPNEGSDFCVTVQAI